MKNESGITMIFTYEKGQLNRKNSYLEILGQDVQEKQVISVVGAGGKTTTIFRLAGEYRAAGIPVIVTTTTHMQIEDKPYVLLKPSLSTLQAVLEKEGMAQIGIEEKNQLENGIRKMKSVSPDFFREICALDVPVLIEADGAKRLPCKVPAEWEPVIPSETTKILSVYGLDAVGKPIREVCFRAESAAEILKKDVEKSLMPEDIAILAAHKEAGKKGIGQCPYYVLLNKADNDARKDIALEICRKLEKRGIADIIVTSCMDDREETESSEQ